MDDKAGAKLAAAQERPRTENHDYLSDRVKRTRQNEGRAADAAALSVASWLVSRVIEPTRRGLRAVARLPAKGLLKIGLAAATLVGFAQPADAAYVNFGRAGYYAGYDVSDVWRGGPQIRNDQYKSDTDMGVGPIEQSLFRSYIFEADDFLPGHLIDRDWYYWLDKWRYYYLDEVQYKLLGGFSYLLGNRFYGAWGSERPFRWAKEADNFEGTDAAVWFNSRRMYGVLYGPVLGGLGWTPYFGAARDYYERAGTDGYGGWGSELQAGDYIDKVQYYLLDEGQYYYLDKWQYNMMGGWSYILGHVCYPLWHGYGYWPRDDSFGAPAEKKNELDEERVDFNGEFTTLDEPGQPGDELVALVLGENGRQVSVVGFAVSIEGRYGNMGVFRDEPLNPYGDEALLSGMLISGALGQSIIKLHPAEVLNGQPYQTIYGAQIQGDINYIPEPATLLLLGLGAVMVIRKR